MSDFGQPTVTPTATPERPWLGLRAYTLETAAYFYGREREIDELFRRIRLEPLTLLYGKSGLGKTSLLGAGLLPRLKVEGWCPLLIRLRFDPDAPNLVTQVREVVAKAIERPAAPLWQQAFDPARRPAAELQRPVLIFDQFEELFTLSAPVADDEAGELRQDRRTEAAELMAELAALIERRPPAETSVPADYDWRESALRIVLTLRDDYLHELERWKKLIPALMRNRVELRELRGPDALDVVMQPACKGPEALIETDVARSLVRFVAKRPADTPLDEIDAVPPLLSLLCTELNEARLQSGTPKITLAQVQGEADQVLERFYQRSFEGMPGGVRRTIEDLLIDNAGRIREASSRDTVLSEMRGFGVADPEACLAGLVDGRLLTLEERGGAPRVELTHDLLVPLVARARERREAERRATVEQERSAAAELAASEARSAQRRAWLVSVTMTVLVVLAMIGGWQAWERTQMANRAAADSRVAEAEALNVLRHAALRALGRAKEQLQAGDTSAYAAYLAESNSYVPEIAQNELALAVQQLPSPRLLWVLQKDDLQKAAFSPDGKRILVIGEYSAQLFDSELGTVLGEPIRHKNKIESAQFNTDATRIVTVSYLVAKVWDGHNGAPIGSQMKHKSRVNYAEFSRDGKLIVTASDNNWARIWDAKTGMPIGAPLRHKDDDVEHAVFSPDGSMVATASTQGLCLWRVQGGTRLGCQGHYINYVMFSPDGRHLLTYGRFQHGVQLWDGRTGKPIGDEMEHAGKVNFAAFSPDGLRVVTASDDGTARIWNTHGRHGNWMRHESTVNVATFSSDGARVITASEDGSVRLWDTRTSREQGNPIRQQRGVISAALSPDGTKVLTASDDKTIRLWDSRPGVPISLPLRHQYHLRFATFSPDGNQVLTVESHGPRVQLWDAQNGDQQHLLVDRHEDINSAFRSIISRAAFSPGSDKVVTASEEESRIWDSHSGELRGEALQHPSYVYSVAFSPDGKRVIIAANDSSHVLDADTGTPIGNPIQHGEGIDVSTSSPDGMKSLTGDRDGIARLWDLNTGVVFGAPMRHELAIRSLAFSPDGQLVVTGSLDHTARTWDARTGTVLGAAMRHENWVRISTFSPDSRRVVTASPDGSVRIWDARTGSPLVTIRHKDAVNSVAINGKGARLVTASLDEAHMWDAQTGEELGTRMGHASTVNSVAFSTDGARIATASSDGIARLWEVKSTAELSEKIETVYLDALSGRRVANNGQLDWLPGLEWMAIIEKVKGEAEEGTATKHQVMRWHFADTSSRTISPFSQVSVQRYIERDIDWALQYYDLDKAKFYFDSRQILSDLYDLDPSHPLILLALSVFENRPETKALWKRLSYPRFEKDARLAARAAEILLIDKDPENARKAAEIALNLTSATDSDRQKAQAVLAQIDSPVDGDAQ